MATKRAIPHEELARITGSGVTGRTVLEASAKPDTTRWEYNVIPLQSNATANLDALNRAGATGWELVQVERLEYLMKRRVG